MKNIVFSFTTSIIILVGKLFLTCFYFSSNPVLEGRSVIPKCFVPSVLILTEFLYLTCFVLAATAEKFSVDNLGTNLRPEFTSKPTT